MIVLAIVATLAAIGWTVVVLFANGMRSSPGETQGTFSVGLFWAVALVLWMAFAFDIKPSRGADLELRLLPPEILLGRSLTPPPFEESATLGTFGTYSTNYMRRRWARLCKGGGRYQAMSEAYERGLANPCR